MKIISHRGWWKESSEKNQKAAFVRSFSAGLATETDVRDDGSGNLVISHDMPRGGEMRMDSFLDLALQDAPLNAPLALNIKADGLACALRGALDRFPIDSFVFDMSLPDMRSYIDQGVPVYARLSEVEAELPWADQIAGVWLDAFSGTWYDADTVARLLDQHSVCVVSPELHRRDPEPLWEILKPLEANERLMLCTDMPDIAAAAIGVTL